MLGRPTMKTLNHCNQSAFSGNGPMGDLGYPKMLSNYNVSPLHSVKWLHLLNIIKYDFRKCDFSYLHFTTEKQGHLWLRRMIAPQLQSSHGTLKIGAWLNHAAIIVAKSQLWLYYHRLDGTWMMNWTTTRGGKTWGLKRWRFWKEFT